MPVKPGTFGPLILGEERFKSEKAIVATRADIFGPLVTGKPAEPQLPSIELVEDKLRELNIDPAKLREAIASVPETAAKLADALVAQSQYTPPAVLPGEEPAVEPDAEPAVVDPATDQAPAPAAVVAPDPNRDGYSTIGELLKALNADELTVEEAVKLEAERPTARKGAYQAITAKEMQRSGGPRPEVLEQLRAAVESL